MNLSIVTTLYESEPFVEAFYDRMSAAARSLTEDYEIVFVDDGTPDDAARMVRRIAGADPRVKLVTLSRNFGHHAAMMAGLAHAAGDRVFLIDVDLEEQPEWIGDFWRIMDEKGSDAVFGFQEERTGPASRRLFGALFYTVFNFLSETEIHRNVCTVRLMTRRFVQALLRVGDKNIFMAGLWAWTGFDQTPVPVRKTQRPVRTASSYSAVKMLVLTVNAITSFTSYPLKLIFFLGMVISLSGAGAGIYLLIRKIVAPESIGIVGWPSLMVSVWFLGGVIIFFIGVVGIYISKMFQEIKDRPRYIVADVFTANATPEEGKASLG